MLRKSNKKRPLDFIAIGDSTLDIFVEIHEASVSCQLNKTQCLLCMEYAEKIPVRHVTKIPGAGNASNAAIGASRLGLRASIVSVLGNDQVGRDTLAHWKQEKVDVSRVQIDRKRESNISTVLTFQGERTILVYSEPRTYVLPNLDQTSWVYYTALGPNHTGLERKLLAEIKRHPSMKLAFNPGTAQLHRGLASLKPILKQTDVLFLNREEANRLLEDGERPTQNILMSFVHLGVKIIVITDGPKGSWATDGKQVWSLPIFPGASVERTGAGDSYGTAFISALTHKLSIPEAMRHGTANAWNVVQHIGPQKGLLTKKEMDQVLRRFIKIQPKNEKSLT